MIAPKLSQRTITALQRVITGDKVDSDVSALGPYQSGPKLVAFFNEHGFNDVYGNGFPSRWVYVENKLNELNGRPELSALIEATVFPPRYFDTAFDVEQAVAYLNKYFAYDQLELVRSGNRYQLRRLGESLVEAESALTPVDRASHQFIEEQLLKCDRKLLEGDYDGAITNARSLLEAMLLAVESKLDSTRPQYDGDLPRLYKRVQKLLNLDPARTDISDSLRQVLGGFVSVVAGLAPMRNKMGDAHARTYRPERHHAKLAVNAAKTVADFLIDTFEYQKAAGRISVIDDAG